MTETTVAHAADVHTDFTATARAHPARTAILHNGTPITYGQLAHRVRALAAGLAAAAGESRRAAILVSRSPETLAHLLGALCAGVAYCPLDAALPPARIRQLVSALGVERVVAAAPGSRAPEGVETLALTDGETVCTPTHSEEDPAYLLFTSGSTGHPKPVITPRRALTAAVRALRAEFALTPADRVLQFAALSWDTCFEEILPALTAGASVVVDDEAYAGSFPRLLRMLGERGVTVLDLPTALWHELVLHLDEERARLPESVRLIVIGGEAINPARLRRWRDLGTDSVVLLNTYGCTETTLVTHAARLAGPGAEFGGGDDIPLGRPLAHVRDHIADSGELLVAGPALATGYLGAAEQTARAFVVADHGDGARRWFHTGDLVARGDDGFVYPRGRTDDQLKVRGVRVNPVEVEAQLLAHPWVAAAAVVGDRGRGHLALTAYVVRRADAVGVAEPRALIRHLRDRLPGQFVPGRVCFVDALAYTASGKVDRAATQRAAETSKE
ncbi:AMP-binding protein [Nocardia sp. NPDC003482]